MGGVREISIRFLHVHVLLSVGPGKDYRHLRNHVWSDMKQVVVKKIRDGQDNSFTRIEAAILEIIGQQDLPITVSIRSSQRPVLAPGEAHTEDQPAANQIEESMDQNDVSQEPRADESSNFPPARSERPIIIHRAASPEAEPDEPQRPTFYRRRLNRVRPELYDHASMIRTLGVRSDRRNKIVGLLPVVDSHSAKRARSSIALQSISFSPKRPCRDMMDSEEEEEEDNREQRRLKQLLLREQIEHYRLLNEKARLENEKLKLEVEAMRPPPS